MGRLWSSSLTIAAALALGGCQQAIVVYACDGSHDDGATPDAPSIADTGGGGDLGADAGGDSGLDAGPGRLDARTDGGVDPCAAGQFCFRGLRASAFRVDVRERVTLTPEVENPRGTRIDFSLRPETTVLERRSARQPAVASEIALGLVLVDPGTGETQLQITEVPPWFSETVVRVRVFARARDGGAETSQEAAITVRGNLVFTMGGLGSGVYTLASDGRPTRTQIPSYRLGELADMSVTSPRSLALRAGGELLVHDLNGQGMRPDILRFEVSGHDVVLGSLPRDDMAGQPVLVGSSSDTQYASLAELPDGRIVSVQYDFTLNPSSRLVVWRSDGVLDRVVPSPRPGDIWRAVAVRANGDLLIGGRIDNENQVIRFDPIRGEAVAPPLVARAPNTVRSIVGMPSGAVYVAGTGYILQISASGVSAPVTGVPGGSAVYWTSLARVDETRVAVTADEGELIGLVEGRAWLRWLRPMGVALPSGSSAGAIAYLD